MENKTIINLLYTDTDYSYTHYFSLNSKLYKLINNQFYYFDTNTNNYIKDEQLDVIFADITLSSVTAIMYSNSQCLVTNDKWYVIDYINSSYTEFTPKYKVSMTGSKFSISEHDGLIYYLSTDGLFVVYNPVNNTYTTYQPCLTYYPYWNSVEDGCIYTISDTGKICVINPIIGFEKEFIDISSYAYETNELIINDGIIHVLGSPRGDSVHLVYELDTDTLYELNDIGECYNPQTDYMFSIDTVLYLIIEGKHYSLSYVKNSSHNIEKIFYVTKEGEAFYGGGINVNNNFIVDNEGNVSLPPGTKISWSDVEGTDDVATSDQVSDQVTSMEQTIMTEIGDTYVKTNEIEANIANLGGWEISSSGFKSADFDKVTNTNGIRLDSNGEIRSKGSWYSSVDGSGVEGWFSRLCSGKWIFGYYDSTQSDPFVPPTGTPYSDISVNGIYMCSQDTILNKSSQYLFAVDTTNDTVSITNSSSNSPALTITNNYFSDDNSYDAPALVLHSPKQGYRNRPLDVRMRVTGEILGTGQSVNNEYCMQMFGEQEYGRIIFRSSKIVGTANDDGTITYAPEGNTADTESSDPLVPSMIGSSTFRWFQGYFMELYSTNGLNTSSDKKIKNHIQDIDANKSLELINSLTPVEYTLKNNANNRKHMGFYAQDVKKTCDDMELGNMSLYAATWHKDGQEQECYYSEDAPDEELQWTLKYEEFIAPLVGAVQALTKRVEDLEADNEKLKEETNNG